MSTKKFCDFVYEDGHVCGEEAYKRVFLSSESSETSPKPVGCYLDLCIAHFSEYVLPLYPPHERKHL